MDKKQFRKCYTLCSTEEYKLIIGYLYKGTNIIRYKFMKWKLNGK